MIILKLSKYNIRLDNKGHIKRKNAFEHVQNAQIFDHPAHAKSIIQAFALQSYIP